MGAAGNRVALPRERHGSSFIDQVSATTKLPMPSLYRRADVHWIRFRFQGREFKRSLKSPSTADAAVANAIVVQTLHRLRTGQLPIPPGVDVGDFILSGGTLLPPALGSGSPEPPPLTSSDNSQSMSVTATFPWAI